MSTWFLHALGALTVAVLLSVPANASVGLVVEGGGTPQVFGLGNGNFLGLLGFDNRAPRVGDATIASDADILALIVSGSGNVVDFYNGTNPINPALSEFDELMYPFTVLEGQRLFDALWVEWTGGPLVVSNGLGGTGTLAATVTRSGDPLGSADVIPEATSVATWSLLSLVGVVIGRRSRD